MFQPQNPTAGGPIEFSSIPVRNEAGSEQASINAN